MGWLKSMSKEFESSLQNTALPSLLLFLCVWYQVDLDDFQWNEVVTSSARNFNNSWPLHLTFSNITKLCPNIWFISFFEKGAAKKPQIFHILKGRYCVMGGPTDMLGWIERLICWRGLRDFCGHSKKCGFTTFPEI